MEFKRFCLRVDLNFVQETLSIPFSQAKIQVIPLITYWRKLICDFYGVFQCKNMILSWSLPVPQPFVVCVPSPNMFYEPCKVFSKSEMSSLKIREWGKDPGAGRGMVKNPSGRENSSIHPNFTNLRIFFSANLWYPPLFFHFLLAGILRNFCRVAFSGFQWHSGGYSLFLLWE